MVEWTPVNSMLVTFAELKPVDHTFEKLHKGGQDHHLPLTTLDTAPGLNTLASKIDLA